MAVSLTGTAFATTVDPTTGTFGELATVAQQHGPDFFTGSGIPTNATNYSVFEDRLGNSLLLALSITPRFSAPTPTNDGNGTFEVQGGVDANGVTLWNFSVYAELTPGANSQGLALSDIGLELLYDLDSAVGTDIDDLGVLDLSILRGLSWGASQNLTFNFLHAGAHSFVTPGLNTFSPDFGEYSFLFRATDFTAASAEGVGVIADAGPAPVPLPAGLPLLMAALGGLGYMGHRRRKAQNA